MKRLTYVLAIATIVGGCGGGSLIAGPNDEAGRDVAFEAFFLGLDSLRVGGGDRQVHTFPVLLVTTAANSSDPMFAVAFGPDALRSATGTMIPASTLVAGRRVRVWRDSNVPVLASDPIRLSADSVLVLN